MLPLERDVLNKCLYLLPLRKENIEIERPTAQFGTRQLHVHFTSCKKRCQGPGLSANSISVKGFAITLLPQRKERQESLTTEAKHELWDSPSWKGSQLEGEGRGQELTPFPQLNPTPGWQRSNYKRLFGCCCPASPAMSAEQTVEHRLGSHNTTVRSHRTSKHPAQTEPQTPSRHTSPQNPAHTETAAVNQTWKYEILEAACPAVQNYIQNQATGKIHLFKKGRKSCSSSSIYRRSFPTVHGTRDWAHDDLNTTRLQKEPARLGHSTKQ